MKRKILIVDDHPVVVLALKIILEQSGFEVIAETNNGVDALKLIKELSPDAVILDIGIPQLDGLEVIERSRKLVKSPPILVLTAQPSDHFVSRCIQAGASGFVSKQKDMNEVTGALRAILTGHSYFPIISNNNMIAKSSQDEAELVKKLSTREMVVLQQLAVGLSNKEIAERMLLSNKTISTYKTRLLDKLNAKNLVDIIEIAKRQNLI
ncbi:response regulator transcription factor [Shewanella sp. NKUCC05_KAH]|jgi:two-component system response regulator EvgA|uniref:Response regulator transcription factor n=1 Tax=Shewanella oncorhynchi TaxID=2726434 RepID=A0AA50Q663_9GAMM|nr:MULTISPECIES: response regulator transcription factor [Shewanella]RBP79347.1 LuxR family two component transcriptional regulator [Shewanella putrefaciens]MBI1674016.1 response regulator transcription factor [Shewanella sp. DW31]MBW3516295.1 response regulator transcription factor [Shewanella sp. NKUCC01_JLK]MBW3528492.1 response regulator transcription factor [Shewanella sp. NKUCC05_KAH]MBW3532745.1 response regulator transcription factor [Shewanella sp. NKUCC06_TVS]